ncbi:MAG: biotin carboxylase N-terminal domain-containing protein [Bacteroidota bacterium]|nr:biotin carboxylase N-terminal domain-containing protein [Bacteroidota bacterium]MDP4232351.1 biotin carboxylase N-terminal domain-containing protein [Bacteroidota bacterium]MDP4241490.1 biotin carboxylase N-terminal domain-containing protein [Bacteroidota bacterium]MDP4289013.1 biotin carboxylase N-terminal domain-containing protein [Bacteroidota bacterium]
MHIKNVFIANRSEIARRVIRSAHECGYSTSVAYSPQDATALFVREADQAFALRGNPPRESYLDIEEVLTAARKAKADAVHPGYGFLSENAAFSDAVTEFGMKFIGPDSQAIDLLGDKTKARALARKLGIPTPDGTATEIIDSQEGIMAARTIGYPILLKAAAGGGGKGMRLVEREQDLLASLDRARGEARTAFGDDRVYIEKYIVKPRHIEFQILADSHGNVIHLGERECSIQRRHQKLIEESPSTVMTEQLRREMGEAAIALIREAHYEGAGTVEFLVGQDLKYYFLEVNTRLQVEHPVTEFVTGLDLVREQFRIAEGSKLTWTQTQVEQRGHAIEVRIQAEDVWNDFLPSLGRIAYVRHPAGAFIRNDSGMFDGLEISGYYDSLLSKLIVWDTDRALAIERMRRALDEMRVVGVSTTIPFGLFAMQNATFRSGDFSTAFVETEFSEAVRKEESARKEMLVLPAFAAVAKHLERKSARVQFTGSPQNS